MNVIANTCWDRSSSMLVKGAIGRQQTDHYNDVITIVYSTVYSATDQRKHQSSASMALRGEFTAQKASCTAIVSI